MIWFTLSLLQVELAHGGSGRGPSSSDRRGGYGGGGAAAGGAGAGAGAGRFGISRHSEYRGVSRYKNIEYNGQCCAEMFCLFLLYILFLFGFRCSKYFIEHFSFFGVQLLSAGFLLQLPGRI